MAHRRRRRHHSNPRRHRRHHYRHNPFRLSLGGIGPEIKEAVGLGVGIVGTGFLFNWAPVPANFKVGMVRHATKAAVAVGLGWLVGLASKHWGKLVATGGLAAVAAEAGLDLSGGLMLPRPAPAAPAAGTSGLGDFAAYDDSKPAAPVSYALDHYTGMMHYTGMSGVDLGVYGAYQ